MEINKKVGWKKSAVIIGCSILCSFIYNLFRENNSINEMIRVPVVEASLELPRRNDTTNIGSRLELFVDDYLIDNKENLELRLHNPEPREVIMNFNKPWEGDASAYHVVMKDNDLFKLYYRCVSMNRFVSDFELTHQTKSEECYAESKDGINWVRPNLGIYSHNGSKNNNIILSGEETGDFAPFKDDNPLALESERYKAVGGSPLFAFSSQDGIHWKKMRREPIITKATFDSLNTAHWNKERGVYFAFVRDFKDGVRNIKYCISKDFLNWTIPEWLDFGEDSNNEHLYTNAISPYFRSPHIFIGLPARFVPERKVVESHSEMGISDALFMSSRDGIHWGKFNEPFINLGINKEEWTDRCNYPAWGIVPTSKDEISMYYSEGYRSKSNRLRRAVLRTDGFVSVHASKKEGRLLTSPLIFEGNKLILNYSTSAAGSIYVGITDINGNPIPDYTLGECQEIYGNEIEHTVSWESGDNLSKLSGKPIRLDFSVKEADIYSMRFSK